MFDREVRRIAWSVLMTGLAAVVAVVTVEILPAKADPCPASGAPWNTVYQNGDNGRGARVVNPGMGVFNGDVECGRVSSLIVRSPDLTDYVEVGWYESPQGVYACLPTTSGPVKELAFAGLDDLKRCLGSPSSIAEGTDGFAVRDPDQNGVWTYQHGGDPIWTSPDMGTFNSGIVRNNGERLNAGNTAHADFDGLLRMKPSTDWFDWDATFLSGVSDDAGSHGCNYSDTHTAVKLNGTPC